VDRGFLLLEEADGTLRLSISRFKSKKRMTSDGAAPYSRTIVDMVVKQKVAILTSDAQTDERFESGDSIRIQQIRSAMCAPLWRGETVIGVIYVDSPMHAGSFSEQDLDLWRLPTSPPRDQRVSRCVLGTVAGGWSATTLRRWWRRSSGT
jgi:GAF domain-containing protein